MEELAPSAKESCLSGRKSRTRNAVYALRRIGGSNPSLSAGLMKRMSYNEASFFNYIELMFGTEIVDAHACFENG